MKFKASTLSKGWGLFKIIRIILIFGALISVFSTGISVWNETHELEPVLAELGTVFNPIYTLSTTGQTIAENGLWQNTGHFFHNIWGWITNVYSLLEPIIVIYLFLYYLFMFSEHLIIMDTSRKTQSLIVTLILFFLIQLLYVGILTDLPLKTPFTSIGNLLKIIGNIF